jgi:hypothetical protein
MEKTHRKRQETRIRDPVVNENLNFRASTLRKRGVDNKFFGFTGHSSKRNSTRKELASKLINYGRTRKRIIMRERKKETRGVNQSKFFARGVN